MNIAAYPSPTPATDAVVDDAVNSGHASSEDEDAQRALVVRGRRKIMEFGVRAAIGAQLRTYYDEVVDERLPDQVAKLVGKLRASDTQPPSL